MRTRPGLSGFCLAGFCTAVLLSGCGRDSVGDLTGPADSSALSLTLIQNSTAEVFNGTLQSSHFGEDEPRRVRIGPDAALEIPGFSVLKISFDRRGTQILYRLNPGFAYDLRPDILNLIDLYVLPREAVDYEDPVPFIVTPEDVVDRMLEAAGVGPEDTVYDLGCGDGRIVIRAAQRYGSFGVGLDIDPQRIRESRANAAASGVENLVTFIEGDVTRAEIAGATVVALYLGLDINDRLRSHFDSQLGAGTRVVAHNYGIPGWAHRLSSFEIMKSIDGDEHFIYLYTLEPEKHRP